jgi:hypothetical protein
VKAERIAVTGSILFLISCGCPTGRTKAPLGGGDEVCVANAMADFIGCIRNTNLSQQDKEDVVRLASSYAGVTAEASARQGVQAKYNNSAISQEVGGCLRWLPPEPNTGGGPWIAPPVVGPVTLSGRKLVPFIDDVPSATGFSQEQGGAMAVVGVRVRAGSYIDAIAPIYAELHADGTLGQRVRVELVGGSGGSEPVEYLLDGHIVVALNVKQGVVLDGLQVIFARWTSNGVDPTTETPTAWIGGPGGGAPSVLRGPDRHLAVGFHGRVGHYDGNATYLARLSLIVAEPAK